MRIGFDAKRLFNNRTGLGNYSRNLVKSFARQYPHTELHLYTPAISMPDVDPFFTSARFHLHLPPKRMPGALWRSWWMSREINNQNLDVFHGLSHELPIGLDAAIRSVVTIHDLIYESHPHHYTPMDRWLYRLKYRSSVHRADVVVTASQKTKSALQEYYGVPDEKIRVLYQTAGPEFEGMDEPTDFGDFFLFVGTNNPRKGLEYLIDAVALMDAKDRPLIHVVGASTPYLGLCLNRMQSKGVSPCFHLLGQLDSKELRKQYLHCKALIMASDAEGFGIPVIEAFACKKSAVVPAGSVMEEIAGGHAVVFKRSDPASLSQAIHLMASESLARKKGQESYAHFKRNFDAQKLNEELMGIYSGA